MNKNTVIGSILIAVIVIWWMTMSSNNAKQQAASQAKEKAAAAVAKDSSSDQLVLADKAPEIKAAPVLGDAADSASAVVADSVASGSAAVAAATAAADSSAADSTANSAAPVVEPRAVTVETDKFVMTLTNKGGKIQSVVVKALADSAGKFPELIQDTALGALDLKLGQADLSEALFDLGDTPDYIKVENDATVKFVFSDKSGKQVVRSYGFTKDGVSVRQVNRFVGFRPTDYELSWKGGMKETEVIPKGKSFGGASYFFSELIFNNTYTVERETFSESKTFNKDEGRIVWAGLRRKYVAMAVQFDEALPVTLAAKPMKVEENEKDPGTYKLALTDEIRGDSLGYDFMVLPLQWQEVEALGKGYEKVIVSGWSWCGADVWFVWICKILLKLLNFFYSIIPNYGIAIIIVTFIVRGFTTPFTVKQLKSTRAMSKLKPQLDEINVKYRSDPQKKQAAVMELYAKNGVNPLASCTLGRAIELRGMPAFLWITDLSQSDVVWSGFSIPFVMPSGLAILPWIMVVTTYFQTKVTMTGSAGMDPAQQKMMTWMMPAMMFFFSAVMPSGLVLYWIVSNFWSIAQYKIINRGVVPAAGSSKLNGKNVQDAKIVK